jgi:hypothetical protein
MEIKGSSVKKPPSAAPAKKSKLVDLESIPEPKRKQVVEEMKSDNPWSSDGQA